MPEARWPLSPDAVGWPVRKTAGGVLYGDGRVILALRRADRAYYPGVWNIVGGHARDSEILRTLSIGSCAANWASSRCTAEKSGCSAAAPHKAGDRDQATRPSKSRCGWERMSDGRHLNISCDGNES